MKLFIDRARRTYGRWRAQYPRSSMAGLVLGLIGVLGFAGVLLGLALISGGAFGELPTAEELRSIRNPRASEIYAADGQLLGRYYSENRTFCSIDDVPRHLLDALVATEDERFYEHSGIDYRAWGRVAFKTLLQGRDKQGGGSTISQQLVKNTFPRRTYGYGDGIDLAINKLKEALTARRLERVHTKREILELYLNTVAFSDNTYGVDAAARRYWQKAPADLTVEESASLVAMLKATSLYCPLRNPDNNRARRQLILTLMQQQGYLEPSSQQPEFALNYYRPDGYAGPVPHFRETARKKLLDLLADTKRPDGRPYDLETDGLKIYTTLNLRLQRLAEASVEQVLTAHQERFDRHLRRGEQPWTSNAVILNALQNNTRFRSLLAQGVDTIAAVVQLGEERDLTLPNLYGEDTRTRGSTLDSLRHVLGTLRAGFLVVDHTNAGVLAWVGGGNPYFSAYDNVTGRHQTGSSFKPLVYATALDAGVDPCRRYDNELVTYAAYDNWTPKNSSGEYGGRYSLHGALRNSVNTVAVRLIMDIGPQQVSRFAERVGMPGVLAVPSTALGTHEANLYEMVGAYTAFADGGYYSAPRFIERIEAADGTLIYQSKQDRRKVLDYEASLTTLDMLRGVVDGGTAWRLRGLHHLKGDLAGKTGTTQDGGDGWFIGLTPKLIGGAWVGGATPGVRFKRGSNGNGSRSALPIWGTFLEKVNADKELRDYVDGQLPSLYKSGFPCSAYEEYDDWELMPEDNFEEVPVHFSTEAR